MIKKIGTKIYYLKSNGNVILETGDMQGYILESSFDEDYENYTELSKINKNQLGCIQLEYGELDELLKENKANSYKVDVSSEPHKLIFGWVDYESGEPVESPKTTEELIKEELDKINLEHSLAMAELIEKVEKDKVDLSAAIAEVIEMQINGGTV